MQNGKKIEQWLEPMPVDSFNKLYRPERNFYTFDSIIGLNGLKSYLKNGFSPDVPDRSKLRHVLMLGVPGTGKSMTMKCCSGEFGLPLSSMQASNLYSKWVGDTDKILANMLRTVEEIGGILGIDEFQRFLPQGGSGESGGLENRMLGTLLTWFNDQKSTVILSAANNIANLPDEITRSGRVDALFFVGFPGSDAKSHAWEMYMQRHDLADQDLPTDQYWTPADIASCCRLAEMQRVDIKTASKWITPSYEKNKEQMDNLLDCAETGDRFKAKNAIDAVSAPKRVVRKVTRAKE
jgi:SpoVK/Ycf46/Vps4 family AAA+-type ATPase